MASQYVGIDLHRRRSVIVRQTQGGGGRHGLHRQRPGRAVVRGRRGRPRPRGRRRGDVCVVLGGGCAHRVRRASVHLAHPLGVKAFASRRVIERWHKTLRREFLDGGTFASVEDAQAQLDDWVGFYNRDRPHRSLGVAAPWDPNGRITVSTPPGKADATPGHR